MCMYIVLFQRYIRMHTYASSSWQGKLPNCFLVCRRQANHSLKVQTNILSRSTTVGRVWLLGL